MLRYGPRTFQEYLDEERRRRRIAQGLPPEPPLPPLPGLLAVPTGTSVPPPPTPAERQTFQDFVAQQEMAEWQARREKTRQAFQWSPITPGMVEKLPGWLQPVGRGVQEMLTPGQIALSASIAGVGPGLVRGATGPIAGMLAPIVKGSFLKRFLAEEAVGAGAVAGATEAARLTETAPTPVRVGASLAAGLAGGMAGIGAMRAAPAVGRAAQRGAGDVLAQAGAPGAALRVLGKPQVAGAATLPPDFLSVKGVDKELATLRRSITLAERSNVDTASLKQAHAELRAYRENLLQATLSDAQQARLAELRGRFDELRAEVEVRGETVPIVRPPKTEKLGLGRWSEARLRALAAHEGLDPHRADWWDSIDSVVVKEVRVRGAALPTRKVQIQRELSIVRSEIRELESGGGPAVVPAPRPTQAGVIQAGMGIGERPAQGGLFENLRGEAERIPLVDAEQLALRQARQAEIRAGQAEIPVAAKPMPPVTERVLPVRGPMENIAGLAIPEGFVLEAVLPFQKGVRFVNPSTGEKRIVTDLSSDVIRAARTRLSIPKAPVGAKPPPNITPGQAPTGVEAAAPPPGPAAPPIKPPIQPPVGSLEPPPVPSPGAQGRSLLGDLQDVEELVGIMMRPDVKRRIANLPGIRQLQATFNPAAVAETPVDKGIVARAALREEGKIKTVGGFSTLETIGRREKVWGPLDDQGRLLIAPLKGKSLDEVLTYRKRYDASFTPEQRAWAEQFHALEESKRALLERAGIEINELSFEEGGEYVGRRVMGRVNQQTGEIVETAYIGAGPGRPGAKALFEKERVYRDINDALSDGFRYLTPDEALFLNLRAAYNRVGDHMATDWILRQVPWRTTEVFSLPKASALVRQAMKKEIIPASRLVALRRDMPEIAQRIEAAQAIEDWPTRYSTLQGIKEDLRKIIPETEAKLFWAVERITRDRKNAQAGIAAILRALRGETLPTGTVRAIERVLPHLRGLREQTRVTLNELIRAGEEAATYPRMLEVPKPGLVKRYQKMLAEAEAALAADPGNAALGKEVRQLRGRIGFTKYRLGLGEPLEFAKSPTTILTGQHREALEETLTLLRGEAYETRTATGQPTVKFRGGRVAELRKEELAAIKLRQEVVQRARTAHYGEAAVAAPAFQGKILIGPEARANAEALNRAFVAQYGKLDEILDAENKVNAIGRYFMLAGDASTLMIQLIAFPFRFPHKMPKILLEATKAMFSPEAQAAYLAANNPLIQGSRNLILSKGGQTEYTEAFRTVGWVTAKFSPGKLLVPFQRFFEGSLDAAGIELRKGFSHLADTPANAADVEQFINEVRGVTSSARLGVSGSIQRGETALFLAPRYNRAFAAWATDVLGGGIRGDQARKSLAALIAGWTAIGVAISLAQGEGWEGAQRHLTPGDPDFMTWTVSGQRVGPGSKIRSALMLLGRITREPERMVDHVNQFVRSNLAPVPGKGLDILLGRNFIGAPTRPGRGVGWGEGMLGLGRTLSEGMIPIWSQSVAMEGGDVGGRAVRGPVEFFGGRAYPATLYMEFSGRWRKELKPYFDIVPKDETYKAGQEATKARAALREAHPEVEAKLFIIGQVTSFRTPYARSIAVQLMQENGIDVKDIAVLNMGKKESPSQAILRRYFEQALSWRAGASNPPPVPEFAPYFQQFLQ